LAIWILIIDMVVVILSHLAFFFASRILPLQLVIRKLSYSSFNLDLIILGLMEMILKWSHRQIIRIDVLTFWARIKGRRL